MIYDLIIVGSGAAGLFLAAHAPLKNILVLEKMSNLANKVLISGGAMCNISNCDETDEFLKNFGNKKKSNFLKPSLLNFSTNDLRKWLEIKGFKYLIREDGKIFPQSLKSESFVNFLINEAKINKVEFKRSNEVKEIKICTDGFLISTELENFKSTKVLLCTGGKSYESTGSDGSGYNLAKALGHKIVDPTQALVAVNLVINPFINFSGNSIKGSSVDFFRSGETKKYNSAQGDLLFTHKGLSGPVILNNSRIIKKNDELKISLITTENKEESRKELHHFFMGDPKSLVKAKLKSLGISGGLSDYLLNFLNFGKDKRLGSLNKKQRNQLIHSLLDFTVTIGSKGGFKTAMVTAGGIDLHEIERKTMESKIVKGLYFAGEIMDIDGNTGGYNLQAAFSTALIIKKSL